MKLKMPYGISNYEELITENYYYVDKTQYIEKLENLSEKRIMFLRPRKFGKTLFTSVIENYYDIKKEDKNSIKTLGKLLGKTDVEGQINQIQLVNSFLEQQINEATEAKNKNEKMYQKLGAIVGLIIVIVLI